jgi:rubrerythrin
MTESLPKVLLVNGVTMLLAYARAIEIEAAERYLELAEQMDVHNSPELANLFRKMAAAEQMHLSKVDNLVGTLKLPEILPWQYKWDTPEALETTAYDAIHYQMTPRCALQLALANEERAVAFFNEVVAQSSDSEARRIASELAAEEYLHVEIVRSWLDRFHESDFKEDLDNPVSQ